MKITYLLIFIFSLTSCAVIKNNQNALKTHANELTARQELFYKTYTVQVTASPAKQALPVGSTHQVTEDAPLPASREKAHLVFDRIQLAPKAASKIHLQRPYGIAKRLSEEIGSLSQNHTMGLSIKSKESRYRAVFAILALFFAIGAVIAWLIFPMAIDITVGGTIVLGGVLCVILALLFLVLWLVAN